MVLEFRQDPLKGTIVVVANERANRPLGPRVACPFCPGAESVTPPTKLALPDEKKWKVRCFDNAFAIVRPKGKYAPQKEGDFFYVSPAVGEHEVIVESNDHRQLFQDIENEDHARMVFQSYKRRFEALAKKPGTGYVHLYKNHGRLGGASIDHEHSQMLSLPFLPQMVRDELERMKEYGKRTGGCLVCDLMKKEKANVLARNAYFVALCPSFARFPFEIWIISREHSASILDFNAEHGRDLMSMLRSCVRSAYNVSKDYNIVYHNDFGGEYDSHFHAEIYPRPNVWAGLELGTGVIVNTKTEKESLAALSNIAEYRK